MRINEGIQKFIDHNRHSKLVINLFAANDSMNRSELYLLLKKIEECVYTQTQIKEISEEIKECRTNINVLKNRLDHLKGEQHKKGKFKDLFDEAELTYDEQLGDCKPDDTRKYRDKPILLTKKLLDAGFRNDQIEKILTAIEATCSECWDTDTSGYARCTCTMDW